MRGLNAIALFCEDIREEKNEMTTIVGIFPDNINVAIPPGSDLSGNTTPLISKLGLYVRFTYSKSADEETPPCDVRLVTSDGHVFPLGGLTETMISESKKNATEKGTALAGVTLRGSAANLPLLSPGIVRVEIQSGDEIEVIGGVNFQFPETTSSTASEQPS